MTQPTSSAASRRLGHLYLTLAMITVGSTVIAAKLIANGLPPFTATALRFALALPLFALMMAVTRTVWPPVTARTSALLIVQAGAGSVGYTTLLIAGLHSTSAADAGVIIGTLPVVAALVAVIVLGERPPARLWAAIGFATLGVAIVSWPGEAAPVGSAFGNALILAAVGCEAVFILLNKRLAQPLEPLVQSTAMTALGFVISAAVALAVEDPFNLAFDQQALLATAYYAVVPTALGFTWWYAGAARVSGSEAALFTAVAPITAVALAGLILGEPVTTLHGIGIVCVLAAILGATQAPRRP
jgi:drug/metabolite transporter (DMT)-like permease